MLLLALLLHTGPLEKVSSISVGDSQKPIAKPRIIIYSRINAAQPMILPWLWLHFCVSLTFDGFESIVNWNWLVLEDRARHVQGRLIYNEYRVLA